MHLEQALVGYGLLADEDFFQTDGVDQHTSDHFSRIARVVNRVAATRFGAAHRVGIVPHGPARDPSGGLKWDGYGYAASFSWHHTDKARRECSWRCGLVESMFRRWATGLFEHYINRDATRSGLTPEQLQAIPRILGDWR
jgi:hypothetical protein